MNRNSEEFVASIRVSIGIIAWNEEEAIGRCLESLFAQSLFRELDVRGERVEIICITNGCTDSTPVIVQRMFHERAGRHPFRAAFSCRHIDVPERGKLRAWNRFVHDSSAREATFLVLMDGDIVLHDADTLWNMVSVLAGDSEAWVSTDEPLKDIAFKKKKSFREYVSLATSTMSRAAEAQLTGQLYCIRTEIARRIYLPIDLAACEDGFIKALVCTDFLTKKSDARRIVRAQNASHIFEAYTSTFDVLRNQKRQMIGQTFLHVLDSYLRSLPRAQRESLAATLREQDQTDPMWLKRLVHEHLRKTDHFWQIFPGVIGFRFRRLVYLKGVQRWTHAPVALVGFGVTMFACFAARRRLEQGFTQYWPDTKSRHLQEVRAMARREGESWKEA